MTTTATGDDEEADERTDSEDKSGDEREKAPPKNALTYSLGQTNKKRNRDAL